MYDGSPALCIKASTLDCRTPTSYDAAGTPLCSSDYRVCTGGAGGSTSDQCADHEVGLWAERKCPRKLRKGRCHNGRAALPPAAFASVAEDIQLYRVFGRSVHYAPNIGGHVAADG